MNNMTPKDHRARTLPSWLGFGLAWACLLLLPVGRMVEIPVLLMAALGLWLVVGGGWRLHELPAIRLFGAVFLAMWLPQLLALPGAVEAVHSSRVALTHLRFFLGGIFLILAIHSADSHEQLLRFCAWLLTFWLLDAMVQMVFGHDLFGFGPAHGRPNALFGESNLKFSFCLALLSPLLWEHAWRYWPVPARALVFLATVSAVLIAGNRSAWVMLGVVLIAYAALYVRQHGRTAIRPLIIAIIGCSLCAGIAYRYSPLFSARVDRTVSFLSGERDPATDSIAHRMLLWNTAKNMFAANPLTGVGPRGFRYAYSEYAEADDPYLQLNPPIIPTNTHNLLTELAAETGLLGLAGLLTTLGLLLRSGWRATASAKRRMLPYSIALLVAFFPFNSHFAIYSAFWSQLVWWLIALYCAALGYSREGKPAD